MFSEVISVDFGDFGESCYPGMGMKYITRRHVKKVYERSGKNFWSIKRKSRDFRASSLSTHDFST